MNGQFVTYVCVLIWPLTKIEHSQQGVRFRRPVDRLIFYLRERVGAQAESTSSPSQKEEKKIMRIIFFLENFNSTSRK